MKAGKFLKALICGAAVGSLVACGSGGSNNDQGVAFTFLGYSDSSGTTCSTTPNLAGGFIPLGTQDETSNQTGAVTAGIVLQNNLIEQFIRSQFISLDYIVPGAQVQPPSTTVPMGGIIQGDSEVTPGVGAGTGGRVCIEAPIVPPEITAWLSFNRASLPEPPFQLQVTGFVTGVSSSGNVYDTNPVNIGYIVTTDNVIPPSSGGDEEEDGAATGSDEAIGGSESGEESPVDTGETGGDGGAL